MVEQALNVLTLHVYWKAKGLLVNKDADEEDNPYREKLVNQRESLLEKLQDYAIGTQSNTGDGVQRAVYHHNHQSWISIAHSPFLGI
jgi:cohesin complex subunit SA-1/2